MLQFIHSSKDEIEIEEIIMNSDPYHNRVTKGKEVLTREEILADIEQTHKLGAHRYLIKYGENFIGILDYLLKNPKDQSAWLGLLLIKKDFQSRGYGTQVLALFEDRLRKHSIRSYRICVILENEPAHRFWKSHGFVEINSTINDDNKEIIIYEKNLGEKPVGG